MSERGMNGRIAAFFDLDATLIGEPSLERRFYTHLRQQRVLPVRNYFWWLARAAWLAPRGGQMIRHANKMYLRGVRVDDWAAPAGQPEMAVPRFFPEGVDQMAWHGRQGHAIVLVSGTLAPLAQELALALTVRLAVRGVTASVGFRATRLEERNGRWTGRILGEAMVGEAKARAIRRLAAEQGFDLARCYAYGDSMNDRAMLEAVGRPCVVNPVENMEKLARHRDWAVLAWREKGEVVKAPSMATGEESVLGSGRMA